MVSFSTGSWVSCSCCERCCCPWLGARVGMPWKLGSLIMNCVRSDSDGRAQSDVKPRLRLKYSKSCNGSYALNRGSPICMQVSKVSLLCGYNISTCRLIRRRLALLFRRRISRKLPVYLLPWWIKVSSTIAASIISHWGLGLGLR